MKQSVRDLLFTGIMIFGIAGFSPLRAQEDGLKKGLILLNEGKMDEAVSVLRQEMEKNPQKPDIHLALGVAYLQQGNNGEAHSQLKKAAELDPSSVPASYLLAMLYEKEKRFASAVQEWKKVRSLTTDKDLGELARKHIQHLENDNGHTPGN